MSRTLRPRDPLAVVPAFVTQHSAAAHGFRSGDAFLDLVRKLHIRHTRVGKTVFVDLDDLRISLRAASVEAQPETTAVDDNEPTTAEILARAGWRAGTSRRSA